MIETKRYRTLVVLLSKLQSTVNPNQLWIELWSFDFFWILSYENCINILLGNSKQNKSTQINWDSICKSKNYRHNLKLKLDASQVYFSQKKCVPIQSRPCGYRTVAWNDKTPRKKIERNVKEFLLVFLQI